MEDWYRDSTDQQRGGYKAEFASILPKNLCIQTDCLNAMVVLFTPIGNYSSSLFVQDSIAQDLYPMVDLYPAAILDSDAEADPLEEEEDSDLEEEEALHVRKKRKVAGAATEFAASFQFDMFGGTNDADRENQDLKKYLKKTPTSTLEEKIAAERKRKSTGEEMKMSLGTENPDQEIEQLGKDARDALKLKDKKGKGKKSKVEMDFFEELKATKDEDRLSFDQMNLSRPILKSIGSAGYTEPTPIQEACIPVGLAGKDICACSATGTGKTAAFALPILERLLYRPSQRSITRVLVLVPTRELAIQVFQVFRKLSVNLPHPPDVCLCAGAILSSKLVNIGMRSR
ncbi:unnamed protein product, partial [Mesorhabditis spiculigera]